MEYIQSSKIIEAKNMTQYVHYPSDVDDGDFPGAMATSSIVYSRERDGEERTNNVWRTRNTPALLVATGQMYQGYVSHDFFISV